jgi:D-sedoheptulose 7-phosphate isomerase
MNIKEFYKSEFSEHKKVLEDTEKNLEEAFCKLVDYSVAALKKGGKIIFMGNGGSAADAQHLATELAVRYKEDRAAIAALSLSTDTSALTAIGNDFGFEYLFSRQIEAIAKPEDFIIGITTSGKSPNIIKAFEQANKMGIKYGALSGKDGGDIKDIAGPILIVPSNTTARIQEMHIMLGQMLCNAIEYELGLIS